MAHDRKIIQAALGKLRLQHFHGYCTPLLGFGKGTTSVVPLTTSKDAGFSP